MTVEQFGSFLRELFIDKYVGKARVIVHRGEKRDHQILEIVKPNLRELNPSSFPPMISDCRKQ